MENSRCYELKRSKSRSIQYTLEKGLTLVKEEEALTRGMEQQEGKLEMLEKAIWVSLVFEKKLLAKNLRKVLQL